MALVSVISVNHPEFKFKATFSDGKTVYFGSKYYSYYVDHKCSLCRERWLMCYNPGRIEENARDPVVLERYILMECRSIRHAMAKYKAIFAGKELKKAPEPYIRSSGVKIQLKRVFGTGHHKKCQENQAGL